MTTLPPLNDHTSRDDRRSQSTRSDVDTQHADVRADLRAERKHRFERVGQRQYLVNCVIIVSLAMGAGLVATHLLSAPKWLVTITQVFIGVVSVVAWYQWLGGQYRKAQEPVRWHCFNCDKSLNDCDDWICGHCDFLNRKRFLLADCENCLTPAASYECRYCKSLTYFTKDRIRRLPARYGASDSVAKSKEEIRSEQTDTLQGLDHQIAELKRKLEIRDLESLLSPQQPPDERQAAINAAAREIDRIVHNCRTIADSAVAQEKLYAELDHWPGLDAQGRMDIMKLASLQFANFRRGRGGEISMDAEKRPSY